MKIDNEPVIYTKVHGLRFGTYKNDIGISKVLRRPLLLRKWHREPDFMDLLVNSVGRGDVVFDLGGNIGYATTLLSKLVGGSGTVFAVEPSLSNFKLVIS